MQQQKLKLKRKESQLTKQLIVLIMIAGFATCVVDPPESGGNVCQTGKYFDQQQRTCLSCSSQCLTCIGTSENCLSCASDMNLLQIGTGDTLSQTCRCSQGKRFDKTTTSCQPCAENCALCSDTRCLICLDGTDVSSQPGATCSALAVECPQGQFYSKDSSQCEPCDAKGLCGNCFSISGSTFPECTQCQGEGVLAQGDGSTSCAEMCSLGKFNINRVAEGVKDQLELPLKCHDCRDPQCEVCDEYLFCKKCGEGFELTMNGRCQKVRPIEESDWCPRGHYYDGTHPINKCRECIEGCASCKEPTSCDLCLKGYKLNRGECLRTPELCLPGQGLKSTTEPSCYDLSPSNCIFGDSSDCYQCKEGYHSQYLLSGGCQSDSTDGYEVPTLGLDFDSPVTPDGACTLGEYFTGITCKTCGENCAKCNSNTQLCQVCRPGYVREPTNCILEEQTTICGKGKYPAWNGNQNSCKNCPNHCLSCKGDGKCEVCFKNFQLNGDRSLCFYFPSTDAGNTNFYPDPVEYPCKEGEYQDGLECKPCRDNCLKCSSFFAPCEFCDNGFTKTEEGGCEEYTPEIKAEDGSTENESYKLGKGQDPSDPDGDGCCNSLTNTAFCAKCDVTNGCTTCFEGYKLDENKKCRKDTKNTCPAGFYLPEAGCMGCKPCQSGCQNCLSEDTCLICHEGYSMVLGSSGECRRVDTLPTNLDQIFADFSSHEYGGYGISTYYETTTSTCPSGYYYKLANSQGYCILCGDLCTSCSEPLTCDSCRLRWVLNPSNKKCYFSNPTGDLPEYSEYEVGIKVDKDCGVGKVFDPTTNTCLGCIDNCAICQSDSVNDDCIVCYPGFEFWRPNLAFFNFMQSSKKCRLIQTNELCGDGRFYQRDSNGDGICRSCSSNCSSCIDEDICVECEANFKVNEFTGNCEQATDYTLTLISDPNGYRCPTGMYLKSLGPNQGYICESLNPFYYGNCWRISAYNVSYQKSGSSLSDTIYKCESCPGNSFMDYRKYGTNIWCYSQTSDLDLIDFRIWSIRVYGEFKEESLFTCDTQECISNKGTGLDSNNNPCPIGSTKCTTTGDAQGCYDHFELKSLPTGRYFGSMMIVKPGCQWNHESVPLGDICREGSFLERTGATTYQCSSCPENCASCTSSTTCTQCKFGFYQSCDDKRCHPLDGEKLPEEVCPEGTVLTYTNGFTYSPTQSPGTVKYCQTCANSPGIRLELNFCKSCSASDPKQCTACIDGAILESDGECKRPTLLGEYCPYGWFHDDGECNSCGRGCKICSDSSSCLECWPGESCTLISGLQTCPDGKHFDFETKTCKDCSTDCQTCVQKSNRCTSCESGLLLKNEVCEYPMGTYLNAQNQRTNCPAEYNCKTCKYSPSYDKAECTECYDDEEPKGNFTCFTFTCSALANECPDGEYDYNKENDDPCECTICPTGCNKCLSQDQCLSCEKGYILDEGVCTPVCQANEILDTATNSCSQCPTGCENCSEEKGCTQCQAGYQTITSNLWSKKLRKHITLCTQLSCSLGEYKNMNPKIDTPANFLDFEVECSSCPDNCDSCTSEGCTTCQSGYELITGNCYQEFAGFYYPPEVCPIEKTNCPDLCVKCDSRGCQECQSGLKLINGVCRNCYDNEYEDTNETCQPCSSYCADCLNASHCFRCEKGYILLDDNLCYPICTSNQYRDVTQPGKPCLNCPSYCTRCTGPNTCTGDCLSNYVMLHDVCYPPCIPAQFRDMVTTGFPCVDCMENCDRCHSASTCYQCKEGYEQINNICYALCPEKQFRDPTTLQCTPCNSKCKRCSSLEICSICESGHEFIGSMCYPECQSNEYRDLAQDGYPCVTCPDKCETCTSSDVCTTCVSGFAVGSNLKCLEICEPREFRNAETLQCDNCRTGCAQCCNLEACKVCDPGFELIEGICYTPCAINQYRTKGGDGYYTCTNCPSGCSSCLNSNYCLTCDPNFEKESDNLCHAVCQSNQFRNPSTLACNSCPNHCSRCLSNSLCTECNSGYTRINGLCYEICPYGEYRDASMNCQSCHQDCASCYNSNTCHDCKGGYEKVGNMCYPICSATQYRNPSTKACGDCSAHPGCVNCLSQEFCVTCNPASHELIDHKCYSQCLSNQYRDTYENDFRCLNCASNCLACLSSNYCLQCKSGLEEIGNNCYTPCGSAEYRDPFTLVCKSCSSDCATCTPEDVCTNCVNSSTHDLIEGRCYGVCRSDQYRLSRTNSYACTNCPNRCTTCVNSNQCITCESGYHIGSNGLCLEDCEINEFRNPSNLNCESCGNFCLRCLSATECLRCNSNSILIENKCYSLCALNQFRLGRDEQFTCMNCHSNCASCSSSTQCHQCISEEYDLNEDGICRKKCTSTQYRDSSFNCVECPLGCETCTSGDICTSCYSVLTDYDLGFQFIGSRCYPVCASNEYRKSRAENFACASCSNKCLSCLNAQKCYTCDSGFEIGSDDLCHEECPARKFRNADNNVCESCPSNCASCISNQVCTSCEYGYEFVGTLCYKICESNEYRDQNNVCQSCPGNCETCLNSQICLTCSQGFTVVNQGLCYSICEIRDFRNPSTHRCEACPRGCASCGSSSQCYGCLPGYEKVGNLCYDLCASNEWRMGLTCTSCSNHCTSCSHTNLCHTCADGYELQADGFCYPVCATNQFRNPLNFACEYCPTGCGTCYSLSTCSTCNPGYEMIQNLCYGECSSAQYRGLVSQNYPCLNCVENCLSCESLRCSTCKSGYMVGPNGNCIEVCQVGQFRELTTELCKACPTGCYECSSLELCSACDEGYQMIGPLCYENCLSNQFIQPTTAGGYECENCPQYCATCLNSNTCTQCVSDNYEITSDGLCKLKCGSNQFRNPSTLQCTNCPANCATCSSLDICITCKPGDEFIGGLCYEICQTNEYRTPPENSYLCSPCPSKCLTCKDSQLCFTCSQGYEIANNGLCMPECPYGQFRNAATSACNNCESGCAKCSGIDQCYECQSGYDLIKGNCYSNCLSNQFRGTEAQGYSCQTCPNNCATCFDSNICLSCVDSTFEITSDKKCKKKCLSTQYRDPSDLVCKNCEPGCKTCSSALVCISCYQGFEFLGSLCEVNCLSDHYRILVGDDYECRKCPTHCKECNNSESCTVCESGYEIGPNKLCIEICGSRQFRDPVTLTCSNCPEGTKTCLPPTGDAAVCDEAYELVEKTCMVRCRSDQYRDLESDGKNCDDCSTNCIKCESKSQCLICINGFTLLEDGNCGQICPVGQYRDVESRLCEPCPTGWTKCISDQVALDCAANYDMIDSKCYLACETNQWRKGAEDEYACAPCSDNCLMCVDDNLCLKCPTNFDLASDDACYLKCQDRYFRNAGENFECQPCPGGCSSCSSTQKCATCDSDYEMIETLCYPKCQSNEYRGPSDQQYPCLPCSANCKYCSGEHDCDECLSNFFLAQNNYCYPVCQSKEYRDPTTFACDSCDFRCSSCTTREDCSLCEPGYELIGTMCYIICQSNEFRKKDLTCKTCPQNCATCLSSDTCTTCVSEDYEITSDGLCKKKCESDQFRDPNTLQCTSCPGNCLTCTSLDTCTTCKTGFEFVGSLCYETCESDEYRLTTGDGYECVSCPANCLTCRNSQLCLTCPIGFEVANNGLCLPDCPIGQFKNVAASTCDPCESGCAICFGLNKCNQCSDGYTLIGGKCYKNCLSNQFRDLEENNYQCVNCPSNCATCLNLKHCTTCIQGEYEIVNNGICYPLCKEGQFRELWSGNCPDCIQGCSQCFNSEECHICKSGFTMINNKCYPVCNLNQYRVTTDTTSQCFDCNENCLECIGENECTVCKTGFTLGTLTGVGRCLNNCPLGQYRNHVSQNCDSCEVGCKDCCCNKCCSECEEGYEMLGSECFRPCGPAQYRDTMENNYACRDCPLHCTKCSDSEHCSECDEGFMIASNQLCLRVCHDRSYRDSVTNRCVDCRNGCSSCWSDSICTKCQPGYEMIGSMCYPICPTYTYRAGSNLNYLCLNCPVNCKTCLNGDFCETCDQGYTIASNNRCLPECNTEEYRNAATGLCDACPSGCATCSGPLTCRTCKPSFTLIGSYCYQECQTDQWMNPYRNNECINCPDHCTTCINSEQCNSCEEGYEIGINRLCVEICPESQFMDWTSAKCSPCPVGCSSCLSPFYCSSCRDGFELFGSICKSKCLPNQYRFRLNNYDCQNCPANCADCLDSSRCYSCDSNIFEIASNKMCLDKCDEGHYRIFSDNRCNRCPIGCTKCNSYKECDGCDEGYIMIGSLCYQNCRDGEFRAGVNQNYECIHCPTDCKKCTNANICTECSEGFEIVRNKLNQNHCLQLCCKTDYRDYSDLECKPCPTGCNGCYLSDWCEGCLEGYKLIGSMCYQECKYDQYRAGKDQNFQCINCPNKCESCSNSRCDKCDDGYELERDGNCYKICEEHEYRDPLNLHCLSCQNGCDKCQSSDVCLECTNGYQMIGTSCFQDCEVNQYVAYNENSDNYVCTLCPANCETCTSATECQTCKTDFELENNMCYLICQSDQYRDPSTKNCFNCPGPCKTCSSPESCDSCDPGYELNSSVGGVCYEICESNQFRNTEGVCTNCPAFCTKCDSLNKCTDCVTEYAVGSNGMCLEECEAKEYRDAVSKDCRSCNPRCATCSSYNTCVNCPEGYVLIDNMCYAECNTDQFRGDSSTKYQCFDCPENSATCDNLTICTACKEGYELVDFNDVKLCYQKCEVRQFRDFELQGLPCSSCPELCLTCENKNSCAFPCEEGAVLLDLNGYNLCYDECGSNEWRNVKNSADNYPCVLCENGCTSCKDDKECTTCEEGMELVQGTVNKHCYDKCTQGFWRNLEKEGEGFPCEQCMEGCVSCRVGSTCDACDTASGYFLSDSKKCLKQCGPAQWRFEEEVQCRDCETGCTECESNRKCLSCKDEFTLVDGFCQCITENGVYLNNGQCNSCHKSCSTCSSRTKCDSCPEGKSVQIDGACGMQISIPENQICPDGTYDNRQGFCVECDWICQSCFGPGPKRCMTNSCTIPGYVTYFGECRCPQGFYSDTEGGVCDQSCHSSCGFCVGPGRFECLTCSESGAVPDVNGNCINCANNSEDYPEICGEITKPLILSSPDPVAMVAQPESEGSLAPKISSEIKETYKFYLTFDGIEEHEDKLTNTNIVEQIFKSDIIGLSEDEYELTITYIKSIKSLEISITASKDLEAVLELRIQDSSALIQTQLSSGQQWDGSADNVRRRNLQIDSVSTVILQNTTIQEKVTTRRKPSDKQIKFAQNLGVIVKWIIILVLVLGILYTSFMVIKKMKGEVAHLFFRYLVTVKFFSKLALINLNFGTILSTFLGQIFWLDYITMWKIFPELKFRGALGGKFDEYLIPVMVLNSAIIATVLYLVSFILSLVLKKVKPVKKVHYFIMGFSAVDVLFYGGVEIFKHNPFKSGNTVFSMISYFVALITVCCMIFDLVMMSAEGLSPKKPIVKKMKRGLLKSKELKRVIKMNYAAFIRTFLTVALIIASQKFVSFIPWAIVLLANIVYLVFNNYKQKLISVSEIVTCLVLVAVVLFGWDTKSEIFSGPTAETFQISSMILIFLNLTLEFWVFFYDIYHETHNEKLYKEDPNDEKKKKIKSEINIGPQRPILNNPGSQNSSDKKKTPQTGSKGSSGNQEERKKPFNLQNPEEKPLKDSMKFLSIAELKDKAMKKEDQTSKVQVHNALPSSIMEGINDPGEMPAPAIVVNRKKEESEDDSESDSKSSSE